MSVPRPTSSPSAAAWAPEVPPALEWIAHAGLVSAPTRPWSPSLLEALRLDPAPSTTTAELLEELRGE